MEGALCSEGFNFVWSQCTRQDIHYIYSIRYEMEDGGMHPLNPESTLCRKWIFSMVLSTVLEKWRG